MCEERYIYCILTSDIQWSKKKVNGPGDAKYLFPVEVGIFSDINIVLAKRIVSLL